MAHFDFKGIDELIEQFELEAERVERNAAAAVKAGAEVLKEKLEASAPVRTGGLRASIKVGPVKHGYITGYHCEVYPAGKVPNRKKQEYNDIASYLEYGRSNMPARPWIRSTTETAWADVAEAITTELMKD